MANNFKHKDISQIFDMVRDRDHYTVIRDFFELSAISIRNNFDHGNEYANLEKRYTELATAVAETAPNCDENGQFSLF